MELMEIKTFYFNLMNDDRPNVRAESFRRLSESGDSTIKTLADLGKMVSDVINGNAKAETLKAVKSGFDILPLDSFWNTLAETTGQSIIMKALRSKGSESFELLDSGLDLIARAMDGGFPLSEATIQLVKDSKKAEPKLSKKADTIIMQNEQLTPERPFRLRAEELRRSPQYEKGSRAANR